MGTKNNPDNRGTVREMTFNGKKVKPVKYIGKHAGHGNYIAVQYEDGSMAIDNNGKPVSWDAVA